jgi:hypothetical protein
LVIYTLVLLGHVHGTNITYVQDASGPLTSGPGGCLVNGSGANITNLYAYGPDGTLLDPVLLYDQDGHPVDNLCPDFDSQGRPLATQYSKDVNGAPVINAFPRRQALTLQPGVEASGGLPAQPALTVPVSPPAVVVPKLAPTVNTTTTLPTQSAPATTTTVSVTTTAPAG